MEPQLVQPANYFSTIVKDIRIAIMYSSLHGKYGIIFERNGIRYDPKEAEFKAATWECLLQQVAIEMRTSDFMYFLGIRAKNKVFEAVSNSKSNFILCP